MTLKTNMRGFQRWVNDHPRKRLDGYFSFRGRELTHQEVKLLIKYAVDHGYETNEDIPTAEVEKLLNNKI